MGTARSCPKLDKHWAWVKIISFINDLSTPKMDLLPMLNSKHDTRWKILNGTLGTPSTATTDAGPPIQKGAVSQDLPPYHYCEWLVCKKKTTGEHQRFRDIRIQHSASSDFVEALNKDSVHLSAPGGQRFPKSIQKPQIFWLAKPLESRPMAWPSRCRNCSAAVHLGCLGCLGSSWNGNGSGMQMLENTMAVW